MISDYTIDALESELRAVCRRRVRVEAARIPRLPLGVVALAVTIAICAAVAIPLLGIRRSPTPAASFPSATAALQRAAQAAGAGTAAPTLHGRQAWYTTSVVRQSVKFFDSPRWTRSRPWRVETWITAKGVETVRPQGLPWNPPGFANWDPGAFTVQNFPTTASGVLTVLQNQAWVHYHKPASWLSDAYQTPFAKLAEMSTLLGVEPLRPAARAATFEAIAQLPGLSYLGKVRDPLGRPGIAVAEPTSTVGRFEFPRTRNYQFELIFDPATGAVLGSRTTATAPVPALGIKSGQVMLTWAYRSSRLVKTVQLPNPFGPARPRITTVPRDEAAHFAILRRPVRPSDRLSARGPFGSLIMRRTGINPALARRVATSQGSVWVIPGNGTICLWNGGGGCASLAASIAGKNLSWTSAAGGGTLIDGLVPDGVTRVAILLANRTVDEVVVHDNVYAAATPSPMKAVRLGGPHGRLVLGGGPGF